jgi:Flp pilus assembly protein TadG
MFKRFLKDSSGSTAILFGFALIPLIGMVGIAVDYGRASNSKTALQASIDSTALSLAAAASEDSDAELQTKGAAFLKATFIPHGPHVMGPVVIKRNNGVIEVSATATLNTAFMQVLGIDTMTVGGAASATFGKRKIEFALALDNTGSMAEDSAGNDDRFYSGDDSASKIRALKNATNNMVNKIEAAVSAGNLSIDAVRMGVVPFNTQVRVNKGYAGQPWLKFNTAGMANAAGPGNWEGCIADRDEPHDTADIEPDGTESKKAPAAICANNGLVSTQPLSTNFQVIRDTANAMQPGGYTNVTMGVNWGTALLSKHAPFTETGTGTNVERNLLVLTDGINTKNRYTARFSSDPSDDSCYAGGQACFDEMNAKTIAACDAAKNAGITIYVVRLLQGDADTLRSCASTADGAKLYYDVQDLTKLDEVLDGIAKSVTSTRLKT